MLLCYIHIYTFVQINHLYACTYIYIKGIQANIFIYLLLYSVCIELCFTGKSVFSKIKFRMSTSQWIQINLEPLDLTAHIKGMWFKMLSTENTQGKGMCYSLLLYSPPPSMNLFRKKNEIYIYHLRHTHFTATGGNKHCFHTCPTEIFEPCLNSKAVPNQEDWT